MEGFKLDRIKSKRIKIWSTAEEKEIAPVKIASDVPRI